MSTEDPASTASLISLGDYERAAEIGTARGAADLNRSFVTAAPWLAGRS